MGKSIEDLAKALAAGTSRRVALKRFAQGVAGAALANVFVGQTSPAAADLSPSICHTACRDLLGGTTGRAYGQCVSTCASCIGHGGQPIVVNNGNVVCLNGH